MPLPKHNDNPYDYPLPPESQCVYDNKKCREFYDMAPHVWDVLTYEAKRALYEYMWRTQDRA